MDNLETLLATKVDKAHGNASGSIAEKFMKPRASKIFGHPVYSLDRPGQSMAVSGPHEEFFNSAFGIWIGGFFPDGFCRPIRMHEVCRALVLRHHRSEQMSILRHEIAIRWSRVVLVKHGMEDLMLALKEA